MTAASSPPEQPLRQDLTAIALDGVGVELLCAALS